MCIGKIPGDTTWRGTYQIEMGLRAILASAIFGSINRWYGLIPKFDSYEFIHLDNYKYYLTQKIPEA